ncbi:MAG TPA: hypothetical protein DHW82_09410 [Spirochaetia bacterium]|nr:MAG: hypothetical protein A2Y41_03155 [Spirochaetes bacterium GWB1_36_13]HCL57208.1 hypothetical protein [Spirochaetia bacterium]
MGIEFYFEDQLSSLYDILREKLKKRNNPPFFGQTVFVPSPAVGKWLKMKMAEDSVFFNIEIAYLESGFFKLAEKLTDQKLFSIQGGEFDFYYHTLFYEVLLESGKKKREVVEWARQTGSKEDFFSSYETWILAGRLMKLFQEWEYQNPEELSCFENETDIYAFFYQQWMGKIKKKHEGKKNLLDFVLHDPVEKNFPDEHLILFGFHYLSDFQCRFLKKLSSSFDFSVLMNLSLSSEKEVDWGKGGRQSYEILKDVFPEISGLSEIETEGLGNCIRIAACPGIFREIEWIYNHILWSMKNDPSLLWNEIGILCADEESYLPVIETVFSRNPEKKIPFVSAEKKSGAEDSIFEALSLLLNLFRGDLTRKEVFRLIDNPFFLKNHLISYENKEKWLELADKTGIFRDFDLDNPVKPFTWNQGFLRVRFGRIMEHDFEEEKDFQGIVPYSLSGFEEDEKIDVFILTVEKILETLKKFLSGAAKTPEDWSKVLKEVIEISLETAQEDYQSKKILDEFLEFLEKDFLFLKKENREADFIIPLLIEKIGSFSSRKGRLFSEGVNVGKIETLCQFPFRLTYFTGMNEGVYPAKIKNKILDYQTVSEERRKKNPSLWAYPDKKIKPDTFQKFLFLNAVSRIKERGYITYNAYNLEDDKRLYPSSLLMELKERGKAEEREIPFKNYLPLKETVSEKTEEFLRHSSQIDQAVEMSFLPGKAFANPFWEEYRAFHSLEEKESENKEIINIKINDLKEFLVNPVFSKIKKELEIWEDEEEDLSFYEDEPFFTEFPSDYRFITGFLKNFVLKKEEGGSPDWEKDLEREYSYWQKQSEMPEKNFGRKDFETIRQNLKERMVFLDSFLKEEKGVFFPNLVLGQTKYPNPSRKDWKIPPLSFESNGKNIQLSGSLPLVWVKKNVLSVLVITHAGVKPSLSKYELLPLLVFLILSDERLKGEIDTLHTHILFKKQILKKTWGLSGIGKENYLKTLIDDFLEPSGFWDYLPFDEISRKDFDEKEEKDFLESLENSLEQAIATGEALSVKNLVLMRPDIRIPQDAYEKAKRRFFPLYQMGEEKEK